MSMTKEQWLEQVYNPHWEAQRQTAPASPSGGTAPRAYENPDNSLANQLRRDQAAAQQRAAKSVSTEAMRQETLDIRHWQQEEQRRQDLEEKRRAAQAELDHQKALAGFALTENAGAEQGQRISQLQKDIDEIDRELGVPTAADRFLGFISGLAKSNAASATGGQRLLYESGQGARTQMNEDLYAQAKADEERARAAYEEERAAWGEAGAQAAYNVWQDAKRRLDAYGTVVEGNVQQKATEAASALSNELQAGSQSDYEVTKAGMGAAGRFAVDAAAAGADVLIDVATGMPVLNMAGRVFGNRAIAAEAAGATVPQQLTAATVDALKAVIGEKAVNELAGAYGPGYLDDIAQKAIEKAASTEAGQKALQAVYKLGAGFMEEFGESFTEPLIERIYNEEALKEGYGSPEGLSETLSDAAYEGLIGLALAGAGQTVEAARGGYDGRTDPQTQTQTQSDTEPAKSGEKISAPEIQPETAAEGAGDTQIPPAAPSADTAQSETLNTPETPSVTVLYNGRDGEGGWGEVYATAQEALNDAVRHVNPELLNAIYREVEQAEGKAGYPTPMTNALIAVQEDVRQETITPIQGAKLLDEAYKRGGAKFLGGLYRPETGNLYRPYLERAKQYETVPEQGATPTPQDILVQTAMETPPQPAQTAPAAQTQPTVQPVQAAPTQQGTAAEAGQGAERARGFETNVASSQITDPELKARVEQDIQTYKQLGNKDTLQAARDIMLKGLPEAQKTLQEAIGAAKNGMKLSPEMVPLSRLVANELTRNGDVETARRIIADVAVELTAAGQLGQAGRIHRTADSATALATIENALSKINAEFAARMPNSEWSAALTDAEIDLISKTDFTQEGAFEQVYDQIARRIGGEMPVSRWEMLTEFRRINMLLRPRSLIKNVVGNVPMLGLRKGAETLSAALQKALPQDQRTRGFASAEQRGLAREYFAEHKTDILNQGDRWDINSLVRKYKTVFKDGKMVKALSNLTGLELQNALEGMRQVTYKALEGGDAPFVRSAFVDSLSQYMAAQNITSTDGITQAAIDFAMANAMEATFKNANAVATAINNIKRNADPAVAMALDVLFPFTTTPTNIFAQTMKYSPAGLAKGLANAVFRGANASNIDAISKGTVGSAVMVLGIALRNMGLITGGEDEDKDKAALDRATGNNTYSFGGKMSYDWAQPVGSLLSLGAEISDAVSDQESWASAFANALYTAGDSLLYMSLFQNVLKVLKGTGKPTQQVLDTIMEGGATQLIPGLVGDIAKIIDGTVRSTYTGGNVFDDMKAKVQAVIPGVSMNLPPSVNVKGEVNTRGGVGERIVNTLFNPATMAQGERNAVDDEIYRILEETGSKTHFPSVSPYSFDYDGEKYAMTGEERAQFQTTQGQIYQDFVSGLLESPIYQKADADVQREMLDDVSQYALAAAKSEFLEGKGKDYELSSHYENLSVLDDPATYLATVAQVKANQEAKDGTFTLDSPEVFKLFIGAGMSGGDLDKLSDNMSEAQSGYYDGLVKELGRSKANDMFAEVKPTNEYGENITTWRKAAQMQGLDMEDKYKLAGLEIYAAPDPVTGKREGTPMQYEYAMSKGVPFDVWSNVLAEMWAYNDDPARNTVGNVNTALDNKELAAAIDTMSPERKQELGITQSGEFYKDIYRNASDHVENYNESAIKGAKPKVPTKGYVYDPNDIYKILGLN